MYYETYYGIANLGEPYLMHHGIKGMKWGVRRYQNADGSLTAAGEKRYLTKNGKLSDDGKRAYYKQQLDVRVAKAKTDEKLSQKEVDGRKKLGKKLLTAAAIGGAVAIGAYVASKHYDKLRLSEIAKRNNVERQTDRLISRYASAKVSASMENYNVASDKYFNSSRERNAFIDTLDRNFNERLNNSATLSNMHAKNIATYNRGSGVMRGIATTAAAATGGAISLAAVNAHKARNAKKRTTIEGHNKAVEEYNEKQARFNRAFGNVKPTTPKRRKKRT